MTSTLVALGVAFYFSWSLTLVILAAVPFAAILLAVISTKMQPSIDSQKESLAEASRTVSGAISSIETVKAFNGQEFEIWLFSSAIGEAARCYLVQARSNAMQIGLVTLVTLSMFVQGFWYGSTLLGPGGMTAGQIMTTFWSCMTATQSFEQILPHMIAIEKGKAAGAALEAVMFKMERGRRVTDMRGNQVPKTCVGDIDVKNVRSPLYIAVVVVA
jgi:ATP-binding cassette subfamily B (MDR/TAP) protein 1